MSINHHLTRHEWHEVARDTIGVWAPIIVLLLRALHDHRREVRDERVQLQGS